MNRDDFIRMAREAGWQYADGENGYSPLWKFAELVAAAEREECAKACEEWGAFNKIAAECAEAIRARGNIEKP